MQQLWNENTDSYYYEIEPYRILLGKAIPYQQVSGNGNIFINKFLRICHFRPYLQEKTYNYCMHHLKSLKEVSVWSGYSLTSIGFCTWWIYILTSLKLYTKNVNKDCLTLWVTQKNGGVKNVCCHPVNKAFKDIMAPYVQLTTNKLLPLFYNRDTYLTPSEKNTYTIPVMCNIDNKSICKSFSQPNRHRIILAQENTKSQNLK